MLDMCYTVGLYQKGLPEIITFGLPQEYAHTFLNTAAKRLLDRNLPRDIAIDKIGNLPVTLKKVIQSLERAF